MHESGEMYLETILVLHQRQGYVRSIDIANELEFTKPSVSLSLLWFPKRYSNDAFAGIILINPFSPNR